MKKIEAIVRHERLQAIQDALDELGVSGLTVSEVMGCGRQKGYTEQYRGSRVNISLLPKVKVESVVSDEILERSVDAIVEAARTGEIGDGRVFVYDVVETVRIRTNERGEDTVRHEAPEAWGH
jgi:nitrogen regulatory protein P-II 1